MNLGAQPGKVVFLGGLLLLAAYLFYTNVFSGPEVPGQAAAPRPAAPAPKAKGLLASATDAADAVIPGPGERAAIAGPPRSGPKEFRPSLKPRKGEDRTDPEKADPTLRLDILAQLAAVRVERVDRSLFDFSSNPAPEAAKPKVPEPKDVLQAPKKMIGPEPPPPPPPPPVKPPPPPIPLKFFGNALPVRGGAKRVFCMQGEEILTPAEGDVVQRRYKIVRINAASVIVEDLEYKNQQTLPIEEPPKS
jgi:hypothetical protein